MNKLINIRGTSGAGKSHLIREIMKCFAVKQPHHKEKRKQPLYYTFENPGQPLLSVIGHYETACGGCDTISDGTEGIFQLVRQQAQLGNVLFEGLLIGVEVERTKTLIDAGETHVIFLTTPIDTCVAGIQQRRTDRGDERPLNPKNTQSKYVQCSKTYVRLQREAPGVHLHKLDRDAALAKVKELLNLQ